MNFKNKVVWLTGASSGIGAALATELAHQGAILILSSRNAAKIAQVAEAFPDNTQYRMVVFDLAEEKSIDDAVTSAKSSFGHIDVLVNNGGISQRSLALDTNLAVDRRVMEVDYFGQINLTKKVLPHMLSRNNGLIINMASVAGKVGSPMRSAYAGAKHALIGFMDCLRAELAGTGIDIVNVCPGFVKTNISKNALTGDAAPFDKMDKEIAAGMSVEDFVSRLMAKLASKQSEILIARGKPWLGYHSRRLFPNLFHRLLPKFYQRSQ